MKKVNVQIKILKSALLFLLFLIYTTLVSLVDLKPIGPTKTNVGFATINKFVFDKIGVHVEFAYITDFLLYFSLLLVAVFALIGLKQLICGKSLKKVDYQIIAMGCLYVTIAVFYFLFEKIIINYRPIMIDEMLEASYPSSHTFVSLTIIGAASFEIKRLLSEKKAIKDFISAVFCFMMRIAPIGRLLSGFHWFSDIVGGVILSLFLIYTYKAAVDIIGFKKESKNNTDE